MSLPYIPLYIDDYEADTAHLSIIEDGAYNRLLRLLWRSPGCAIPDDNAWVFRRMRATTDEDRAAILTVIGEFFQRKAGLITSPRLLREFKKADETSRKRSVAGKRGGRPKATENKQKDEKPGLFSEKPGTDTRARSSEPEPEPDIYGGGGGARAHAHTHEAPPERDAEPDLQTFREQILTACGVDPVSGLTGKGGQMIGRSAEMAELQTVMAAAKVSEVEVLQVVSETMVSKRAGRDPGPPASLNFFHRPIQRFAAARDAPAADLSKSTTPVAPRGAKHERHQFDRAISALADGLSAGTVQLDTASRDPFAVRSR